MELESGSGRFRVPKTPSQEKGLVNDAVPALDCGGLLKDYDFHKVTAASHAGSML